MKKLIWRLKTLPTTEELRELVKDKIISNDEAREILFSSETEEDRDKKSLESEVRFLRELVEKLSNRTQIVETIKEVWTPYRQYDWYRPYVTWCTTAGVTNASYTAGGSVLSTATAGNGQGNFLVEGSSNFSDIKTF